jgi:two-component sensor histidine kinase
MTTVPLRLYVRRSGRDRAGDRECVRIAIRVPSTLDVVEETLDLVMWHCQACNRNSDFHEFNLRVALGEALQNAIVYGNRQDPAKRVDLRITVDSHHVEVHVRDEGDGFDPYTVPDPCSPGRLQAEDGRGLFLIRQLVDDVSFNERGNSICMVLRRG